MSLICEKRSVVDEGQMEKRKKEMMMIIKKMRIIILQYLQ
jgi:hypothetical protein